MLGGSIFEDKTNLHNMYKIKLQYNCDPYNLDMFVMKGMLVFFDIFVNHFPKIHILSLETRAIAYTHAGKHPS